MASFWDVAANATDEMRHTYDVRSQTVLSYAMI